MKTVLSGAAVCMLLIGGLANAAGADPIHVGSGASSATVHVGFKDGAVYEFEVAFDTPPGGIFSGLDLLGVIDDETALEVTYGYGGGYVDGISFEGHSNSGYGGGEDWWHYWIADEGDTEWTASTYGAGGREVTDGSIDGWVYGSADTPPAIPEPTAMALLAVSGLIALKRRKNRS